MHTECFDAMFPQDQLLSSVHIPETDIDQFLHADHVLFLDPPKYILALVHGQTSQESNWHAVNISAPACLGCVDVAMRIYPDHCHFPVQSLSDCLRSSRNGTNRN